jgi:HEAT repeat protein
MRDRGAAGTDALLQFESPAGDVLCVFTRALSSLDDARAIARLYGIARAGPRDARIAALQAIAGLGDGGLEDLLIECARDPDPEVAKEAISELGGAAGPLAAQCITQALQHDASEVRRLSAAWLARIGDRASVEALFDRLQIETDPLVRNVVVEALEALREVR